MSPTKLSETQVDVQRAKAPQWKFSAAEIERTFLFETFIDAIEFVDALALEAEKAQHHPDIDIRYNKVKLRLTTHDARGLTQKDIDLAGIADKLAAKS